MSLELVTDLDLSQPTRLEEIRTDMLEAKDCRLFIKHEEEYGLGIGGNKERIAKAYLQDMHRRHYDSMLVYSGNHCNMARTMACLCAEEKVPCHIITTADLVCPAFIHHCSREKVAETISTLTRRLRKEGHRPYYIYGNAKGYGNRAVGTAVYSNVWQEILMQEIQQDLSFDHIYVPVGTGITCAGLLSGIQMVKMKNCDTPASLIRTPHVTGISIAHQREQAAEDIRSCLQQYFTALYRRMRSDETSDMEAAGNVMAAPSCSIAQSRMEMAVQAADQAFMPLDIDDLTLPLAPEHIFRRVLEHIEQQNIRNSCVLFIQTTRQIQDLKKQYEFQKD